MSPIRQLWQSMASQKRELALAGLIGGIASCCAVALLGTAAWLISRASEYPPVLTLTVAAVLVRTFALGRALLRYLERLLGHDAAFRGLSSLRVAVYDSLERIAPSGLGQFTKGDLLNRLVLDVDTALDLPLRIVLPWVQALCVSIITVAFLGWLLPGVGVIIGIIVAVALVASPLIIGRTSRRAERTLAPAKAELTGVVVTALNASADLLAFGQINATTGRARLVDDRITRLSRRESFALGIGGGTAMVLQGMAVCLTLALAIPAVVDGRLAPVWLAVVVLLPLALIDVLATLPASALAFERLRGSADRITSVIDTPSLIQEPRNPTAIGVVSSGIRTRGLFARWVDVPVLKGVDLDVSPGQRLAVVGPSGSGKSTLAAVLMGFLAYEGSVEVNGVEVRSASGDDLRNHISVLTQQSHIFDTTIKENICLGRIYEEPGILRSLEQAQLADWVRELPQGLETLVGTFGVAISGGEAQRLCLARFLIQPRPYLVLDEPTEHVDAETARELEATLREALVECATIMITHRLSSIGSHEEVIVLQQGCVTERGTAADLAAGNGWFAEQFRREAEDLGVHAMVADLPMGRGMPYGRSANRVESLPA